MTINLKSLALCFAISALSATASANSLPEGAFQGKSPLVKSKENVMALLLKKDQSSDSYYAVLAEYERRFPGDSVVSKIKTQVNKLDKLKLTIWVPRIYAYQIKQTSDLKYSMLPLMVTATGEIEANSNIAPDVLTLAQPGTLDGATIARLDKKSGIIETIAFNGKVGSTWEPVVPGNYFGSIDSSGGDYNKKTVNTEIYWDNDAKLGIATFFQKNRKIRGQFEFEERAPGLFSFLPKNADNVGNDKIVGRIGVFIDIVNWKGLGIPRFTTEELLLINPEDPSDVGFYYERHLE